MDLQIEPLHESHFERLYRLFDSVCRERRFLAFTEAPPIEEAFAFYRSALESGRPHFVAVRDRNVVGWCDVLPQVGQMRAHVGTLGMAVAAAERGKGIGRQLILAAIEGATQKGLRRIELTVHADNRVAQSLYRSVGFEHEGIQRRGWCLDGVYFDVHYMARLVNA
jgi:ribosomal protein S18 acetylase RimI-like enzyme